jgi:hypothetical protein
MSLLEQKKFPAISIIIPTHPNSPKFRLDKDYLHKTAENVKLRLENQYGKKTSRLLTEKLTALIGQVDFSKLSHGLAIFVASDVERIFYLPFEVSSEKIIVDDSFEIRDLLYAVKLNRNYLLVVISPNSVKTWIAYDSSLASVRFPDMPEAVKAVTNEHSLPGWDYFDKKAWDENNLNNYLLFIDKVIERESNKTNNAVIVMGDRKLLGHYKKHSKIGNRILGYVAGSFEHSSVSELLSHIQPILERENKREEEYAINLLEEAIKKGKYSSGISEVWRSAVEGRGRLLIVEKDYKQSARRGSDPFSIVLDDEHENPWNMIADAVDDVIELIFKNKGDIVFVENGRLKKHQKIVLINRY